MRIKELADRVGVSTRLLRYYEEQGLLAPRREENGYRCYDEAAVRRVEHIRGLLRAGLTTEIIREVLPCLAAAAKSEYGDPDFVRRIAAERERLRERVTVLTRNLQAMDEYLSAVSRASAAEVA
ncbi:MULTISPECIES: MerR family transcriptional regulator [Streptomyces]|uniref:MerR family transcriptional regulator n=1 Tax=Streptomyces edwardsiae TaxID=3075527 RepID=A0ABU2QKP0_9ACTN|nr:MULTISPECIES: MerR family transcriptional regulator [unclassified Streptomyces]MDT0405024.1 MerR family transcriptional regulator [Streptomyces sp. DSM 41635]